MKKDVQSVITADLVSVVNMVKSDLRRTGKCFEEQSADPTGAVRWGYNCGFSKCG